MLPLELIIPVVRVFENSLYKKKGFLLLGDVVVLCCILVQSLVCCSSHSAPTGKNTVREESADHEQ